MEPNNGSVYVQWRRNGRCHTYCNVFSSAYIVDYINKIVCGPTIFDRGGQYFTMEPSLLGKDDIYEKKISL